MGSETDAKGWRGLEGLEGSGSLLGRLLGALFRDNGGVAASRNDAPSVGVAAGAVLASVRCWARKQISSREVALGKKARGTRAQHPGRWGRH